MHQRSNQSGAGQERVAELDGLRALAILMVVAWHYLGVPGGPQSANWRIFMVGQTGVDLFFVLSGYLITGILLSNARASNYFSTFYLRRAFRILPIYFGMVAIYLMGRRFDGAKVLFEGAIPWWSYILGIQNMWMTIHQGYGAIWLAATWSLAIEEQFYLLFPLLVFFAPPRALLGMLVALLILCPIGRTLAVNAGDQFGYDVLMPLRADILAIGALVAWLQFHKAITNGVRRAFWTVFCITGCFFPVFAWGVEKSVLNMALWGHTYAVALFGSALFVVLDRRGTPQLAFLRSRVAAFFARISYALYLVHTPVLVVTFAAVRSAPTFSIGGSLLLIACAFAISVAICWASYLLIEGPLIRMAHKRFRYVGTTAAAHGFSAR